MHRASGCAARCAMSLFRSCASSHPSMVRRSTYTNAHNYVPLAQEGFPTTLTKKMESTSRVSNVACLLPGLPGQPCRRTQKARNRWSRAFHLVAGVGFEPTTFGL